MAWKLKPPKLRNSSHMLRQDFFRAFLIKSWLFRLLVGSCFILSTFQLELCKYRGQVCIYCSSNCNKTWLKIWRFWSGHTYNIPKVWGKSGWTLRVVKAEHPWPKHVTERDDVQVRQLSCRKQAAPQEMVVSCLGSQNARNHQSQRFCPTLTHGRAESISIRPVYLQNIALPRAICRFIQINDSCTYSSRNSSIQAFNCEGQSLESWFYPL